MPSQETRNQIHHNIAAQLEKECPPILSRRMASKMSGGTISPRTLANLDSQGSGPAERVKIGRRSGYTRTSFITFLLDRMELDDE